MSSSSANAHTQISNYNSQTIGAFFSSLVTGAVIFGVQVALFNALKFYFPNIYRPRTFLVPAKERILAPPAGLWRWILPIFQTPDSEFLSKCGLDAYFFLRYLSLLLKVFICLALVILPILLPINITGGQNREPNTTVKGLNVLSWGNISHANYHRYWAHLVLAILLIVFVCHTIFKELRNFIKVRQEYLTSPQHRLRASARTILVTSIPPRWNSVKALDELFDVYPGGIKHIWINRNYQALSDKVDLRNTLASKLESAETNLIMSANKKRQERQKKEQKAQGSQTSKKTKHEIHQENLAIDGAAEVRAASGGLSAGDPHQTQSLRGMLQKFAEEEEDAKEKLTARRRRIPLGVIGDGLGGIYRGVGEGVGGIYRGVGEGVEAVATGVGRLGQFGRRRGRPSHAQFDGTNKDVGEGDTLGSDHESDDEHDNPSATAPDASARSSTADVRGESNERKEKDRYAPAFDADLVDAEETDAEWQKYLEPSDRDTTRLPLFGWTWMPFMPSWTFIGKKVDTIYYCRKELARLNLEIETDQQRPEKFPLMNSAFIQFNQQVAAHMAAQCATHHIPQQMTPRMIEISPDDVLWDNLSLKWWERDLRGYGINTLIAALIIFFIIPSGFVAGLSQLSSLASTKGFEWVNHINGFWKSIIQGIAPAALTSILFVLVPVVLKLLHNFAGAHTGNAVEIQTQKSYFAFLFINLFLFVTIIGGSTTILSDLTNDLRDFTNVPALLANNLPQASNYFFNYMTLQALSISAGALAQVGSLIGWFVFRPLFDTTPRQRWRRPINLPSVSWGKFFPVYTNFACIGIIYAVIAPLVLVFNVFIYGLFWVAYRYNTLYVNKFRFDTGGMLFPSAIKQLFTGLYVMEGCLIGLFFLARPPPGHKGNEVVCLAHAVIMIVVAIGTVFYQYLIHRSFNPLFEYLPITLEDDAVRRDEEFAKLHARTWGQGVEMEDTQGGAAVPRADDEKRSMKSHGRTSPVEDRSKMSTDSRGLESIELDEMQSAGNESSGDETLRDASHEQGSPRVTESSEAPLDDRVDKASLAPHAHAKQNIDALLHPPDSKKAREKRDLEAQSGATGVPVSPTNPNPVSTTEYFGAFSDEIQDLGPRERDLLVEHAFKHRALRARRPVIWVPRDDLGVSDDEIRRTHKVTEWIWISNEGTAINSQNKVLFKRPPPDFSEIDLIDV